MRIIYHITSSGTKSSIQDAIGLLKFKWEDGDCVYAYDGTSYLGYLTLKAEDIGKELGSFEGTIDPPQGSTVKFFYFGNGITPPTTSNTTVDFLNLENPRASDPLNRTPLTLVNRFSAAGVN